MERQVTIIGLLLVIIMGLLIASSSRRMIVPKDNFIAKDPATHKIPFHFITYGTGPYVQHAMNIKEQATSIGGFDTAKVFTKDALDDDFKERNAYILGLPRGDGYWLWKPYIIMQKLSNLADGELLCYCDSMYAFTGNMANHLRDFFDKNKDQDVWIPFTKPFDIKYSEERLTKPDAVVIIGTDFNKNTEFQAWAGFLGLRKSIKSLTFIAAWLTYAQDDRVITDKPDTLLCAQGYGKDYLENRHDQTALSLVAKKWSIPFRDFPNHLMHHV